MWSKKKKQLKEKINICVSKKKGKSPKRKIIFKIIIKNILNLSASW